MEGTYSSSIISYNIRGYALVPRAEMFCQWNCWSLFDGFDTFLMSANSLKTAVATLICTITAITEWYTLKPSNDSPVVNLAFKHVEGTYGSLNIFLHSYIINIPATCPLEPIETLLCVSSCAMIISCTIFGRNPWNLKALFQGLGEHGFSYTMSSTVDSYHQFVPASSRDPFLARPSWASS